MFSDEGFVRMSFVWGSAASVCRWRLRWWLNLLESVLHSIACGLARIAFRLREPDYGEPVRQPVRHGESLVPTGDDVSGWFGRGADGRSRLSFLLGDYDLDAAPLRGDMYSLQPLFPYAFARAWDGKYAVPVGRNSHTGEIERWSGRALFSEGTSGSSTLVLGAKFAGKSTLLKTYIMRAVMLLGFRAWIYDTRSIEYVDATGAKRSEGEFTASVLYVGGSVIRFDSEGQTRLNPLDRRLFAPGDFRGVLSLVEAILSALGGVPISAQEGFALRVQLQRTLAMRTQEREVTLFDLFARLMATPEDGTVLVPSEFTKGVRVSEGEIARDGRRLGQALDKVLHGSLSGYIDGESSEDIDFGADVVSWDFSHVQERHPQAVPILMAVSSAFLANSWSGADKPWGVICIDELWYAMRVHALAVVILEFIKKARTKGGEVLGASQHPNDVLLAVNSVLASMLNDADVIVSFRQESVNARLFESVLGWSDIEGATLEDLGRYESMWKVGDEPARRMVHFLVGEEERLTSTSQRITQGVSTE